MTTAELRIKTRLVVIDEEVRKTVLEVLERTPYYAGPETAAFEAELAAYCGKLSDQQSALQAVLQVIRENFRRLAAVLEPHVKTSQPGKT